MGRKSLTCLMFHPSFRIYDCVAHTDLCLLSGGAKHCSPALWTPAPGFFLLSHTALVGWGQWWNYALSLQRQQHGKELGCNLRKRPQCTGALEVFGIAWITMSDVSLLCVSWDFFVSFQIEWLVLLKRNGMEQTWQNSMQHWCLAFLSQLLAQAFSGVYTLFSNFSLIY